MFYIFLHIILQTSDHLSSSSLVFVWVYQLWFGLFIFFRGQISSFILLLLLTDLMQLLLNIYIVTQLLTKSYWWLSIVFQFWSGLHWCGFHLHQLVALEGVLTLKYPLFSAHICSVPCYAGTCTHRQKRGLEHLPFFLGSFFFFIYIYI